MSKEEVDHIEGIVKTTIRKEIAAGWFFGDVYEMIVTFVNINGDTKHPKYTFKPIKADNLLVERERAV